MLPYHWGYNFWTDKGSPYNLYWDLSQILALKNKRLDLYYPEYLLSKPSRKCKFCQQKYQENIPQGSSSSLNSTRF